MPRESVVTLTGDEFSATIARGRKRGIVTCVGQTDGGTSYRVGKHLLSMYHTGSDWAYDKMINFYA